MLDGRNVALGVTGSIAAVRCVELIHELRRQGASVRVVMSEAATGIVHPEALAYASDAKVVTELTGEVEHIELCGGEGWADVLAIAPATANTIGKVAMAIDDTPVTTCATTAIGTGLPLVVAPAMHEPMYDHPGVLEHLDRLEERFNATVVPPRIEEGKAKIASNEAIALTLARAIEPSPLAGLETVVASGATVESIDPVRVLTTRSSGKTGMAVAKGLFVTGADVTLLHPGTNDLPYASVITTESVDDLEEEAVSLAASGIDAYVSAAAVSDFLGPDRAEKIPSGESLEIEFEPAPKVIGAVRDAAPELPIVGFKAESGLTESELIDRARELLDRYDLAFVVANDASVMGRDDTEVVLVSSGDERRVDGSKTEVGMAIANELASHLADEGKAK